MPKILVGLLTHFKCNGLSLLFALFPSHIDDDDDDERRRTWRPSSYYQVLQSWIRHPYDGLLTAVILRDPLTSIFSGFMYNYERIGISQVEE